MFDSSTSPIPLFVDSNILQSQWRVFSKKKNSLPAIHPGHCCDMIWRFRHHSNTIKISCIKALSWPDHSMWWGHLLQHHKNKLVVIFTLTHILSTLSFWRFSLPGVLFFFLGLSCQAQGWTHQHVLLVATCRANITLASLTHFPSRSDGLFGKSFSESLPKDECLSWRHSRDCQYLNWTVFIMPTSTGHTSHESDCNELCWHRHHHSILRATGGRRQVLAS